MTGIPIFVSFILIASLGSVVTTYLRPGGRNVKTSYEKYYVTVQTTVRSVRYTKTCSQTCTFRVIWCLSSKTVCRYSSYYVWSPTTKRVARYRPVYSCYSGWKASGYECTIPICTGGCQNGGVCISPGNCRCTRGWTGSRCRTNVDECRTNQHSCSYRAGCRDTYGSYRCTCRVGYYLMSDQRTCKDVNECTSGSYSCGANTRCANTLGSYTCPCNNGYIRNTGLRSCKDINECDPSSGIIHGCAGSCNNFPGGYNCSCPKGHYLASNGKDCTDHDECAGNIHGCKQVCINYPGGYNCSCHSGYRLNKTDFKSCDDVDECSEKTSGCAHFCTNTIGSFNCSCKPGYELDTDLTSCIDIDECSRNLHHCQHICSNTPGSYKCSCRPGFDLLQDGRNCAGRPCSPLYSPVNGLKNCSGYTTEEICHFQCSQGYELIGSINRTCTASKHWTGIKTKCKVIHCPSPVEPANGFIYRPCETQFASRCTVGCVPGYYIEREQEITCDANGAWRPENITCREIKVCKPNPCLHGGICSSVTSTKYTCNCRHTGYEGTKCNVGVIITPDYPTLLLDIPSQSLTFQVSPPSDYVILTPINRDMKFDPPQLTFQHGSSTNMSMKITARQPGIHFIRYSLSGSNAEEFQSPQQDTVFVKSFHNSTSETSEKEAISNEIPSGCHKQQLNKCPHTDDIIFASSTSPWIKYGSLIMTSGIVSTEVGVTKLPLSLVGTNMPNRNLADALGICSDESVSYSTESLIRSHVLVRTFLDSMRDSLPKWLDVKLRNNSTPRSISSAELKTHYMTGNVLRNAHAGEGQPMPDDTFFSLLMSPNLNLTIQNDNDVLSSGYHKRSPFSLAVDLCGASPKNVILRPSLDDMDLVNDIEVVKKLKEIGWDFKFYSFQISKKKSIAKLKKGPFWNGKNIVDMNFSSTGNLAFVLSFSKTFKNTTFVQSRVDFEGTAVADINDIDNILDSPADEDWKVDLYGKITFTAQFKVEGKMTNLVFKVPPSVSYAKFGGRSHGVCVNDIDYDPHGLFFSSILEEDPFITSELSTFVELGANKTLTCFLDTKIFKIKKNNRSTYAEINDGVSMIFHGDLKFGPLRYPNLLIQLTIRNSECSNSSKSSQNAGPGLEFSGNYNEVLTRKIGVFKYTSSLRLNLHLHIAKNNNTSSTGSFQTTSNILGFEKEVNVNISDDGLSFQVSGKLHGLYDASMKCFSPLVSWENQVFDVVGEFEEKSIQGSLRQSLVREINNFAVEVINKTIKRLEAGNETVERAKARLDNAQHMEKNVFENVQRARKRYSIAKSKLESAKKHLISLKQAAKNHSKEMKELQSELNELCEVKQCPDVCQKGVLCTKCYHDIIGKTMGMCPATCFKTEQRRIPPYNEIVLCEREKCKRIHSTNGFFKTLFGKTIGGIVKSVLSVGITAVATVLGVPPPVSSALGSGIVTLLDTGRIDETICSVAKGTLTGFIGGGSSPVKIFKQIGKKATKEVIKKGTVALARNGAGALAGKLFSCQREQRDGSWKCHIRMVQCNKERFRYEYEHIPYICKKSCEKDTVTKTIEKSCCSTVPCASFVVNITCVAENSLCKKTRKDALEQISKTKANAAKILENLESARQNVSYWKMRKRREYIKLITYSRSLNTSKTAVRSLQKAYNLTVGAEKRKLKLLAKPLMLRTLMDDHLKSVVMVSLKKIKFKVKVTTRDENTLLPIQITFKLNETLEQLSTVLDFQNLNRSLRSIAKEILGRAIGDLSSVSRKKRSVEDSEAEVSKFSVLKKYHKLCSEFTNYEQTLNEVVKSLYNLSAEVLSLREKLDSGRESSLNASNVLAKFTVNKTQVLKLNVDTSNDSYLNFLESDIELSEAKALQDEAIKEGHEPLQLAKQFLLYNWFATMEELFNDSRTAYECSGLNDCLTYILDSLFDIFSVIDLPDAQSVRKKISEVEKKISNLTRNVDMSIDDALAISSEILKVLEDMKQVEVVCATSPNITKHPEAFTEMGVGENLLLTCNASGSVLVYRWEFNEEILQDQTSNILLIKNTTASQTGNYTCTVSNHIAKETSTPAVVIIHTPPSITVQPVDHMSVALSSDDSLHCEAESTDRNISYQWWFKSTNSTSFSPLANETFSYLNFAPMEISHEGWYLCNVSNKYGFIISKISFIKALHFTLPVPTVTLSVSVAKISQQNESFSIKSNTSGYEAISSHITGLLSSFGNFSTGVEERRIRNLRPVNCQLKQYAVNQSYDADVCNWKFHYSGENVTSNTTVNDDFKTNAQKVINTTLDVKQIISELVNATNNGSLSFSIENQKYVVEENSLAVHGFSLMCSEGQTLLQEDFICVECPPGYYGAVDDDGIAKCQPCPLGTYQTDAGQLSCVNCSQGFTTAKLGSHAENHCEVICPAGHYGVIANNVGQCLPCPVNTYQPTERQFHCLPCPEGHVTTMDGAVDMAKCILKPTEKATESSKATVSRTNEKTSSVKVTTEATGKPKAKEAEKDRVTGNIGLIVGVSVGIIVVLTGVIVVVVICRKRRQVDNTKDPTQTESSEVWQNPGCSHDGKIIASTANPLYMEFPNSLGSIEPAMGFGIDKTPPILQFNNPMFDEMEADEKRDESVYEEPLHDEPFYEQLAVHKDG